MDINLSAKASNILVIYSSCRLPIVSAHSGIGTTHRIRSKGVAAYTPNSAANL